MSAGMHLAPHRTVELERGVVQEIRPVGVHGHRNTRAPGATVRTLALLRGGEMLEAFALEVKDTM